MKVLPYHHHHYYQDIIMLIFFIILIQFRCVHISDIGVGYISTMLALSSLFLRWLFHTFTAIITITSVTFLIIKIHYLCQVVHSDPGLWPSAHLRDEKPSHSLSCRWNHNFHCHHHHRNFHWPCHLCRNCHRHWMRNLHSLSVAGEIIIVIVTVIVVVIFV